MHSDMRAERVQYFYNKNVPVNIVASIKTFDIRYLNVCFAQKLSHTEIPQKKNSRNEKKK